MIPAYLEQLVHEGKAQFRSFSGALAEEMILKVPDKTYIVIYEYWFLPQRQNLGGTAAAGNTWDWKDSIQFVNFFNNNNLYSYFHEFTPNYVLKDPANFPTVNPTLATPYFKTSDEDTQYRKTYIRSDRDLAIYFTRLVTDDLTITNTAVGTYGPLQNFFGYGGETILTNLANYHAINFLPQTFYAPLSNQLSDLIATGTVEGYDNLMTTLPNPLLGGGGEIANASAYAGGGTQALGKARGHHFQCNYVEVNMETPENLI